jgi:PAS domain S-box-containing protein
VESHDSKARPPAPSVPFSVALSAQLRRLADPIAILQQAAEALGQHLRASRVGYAEIDPTGETLVVERDWTDVGIASIAGRHPLSIFGERVIASHARGETWIMADSALDARIDDERRPLYRELALTAVITVPLVKNDRLVALLSVHQNVPRSWTAAEVALVEDVAERSWAAVERARAEADQRESRALLAAIMENAPIGIYLKDVEGRYVVANPEMANLFGRPMSEVLGRTAKDMFGEEYSRSIRAYDEQVLASGRAISVEEHLPGADRYEWTLVMRFPVRTSPDAPLRVGGFDIDITSQKRAEAELERSREALYQSEKLTALGSLLAGVSHELNNPLSIIVAQATLLEHEVEGTPHAARSAKIRKAAERSGRIVQTFLAMARQKRPERTRVDINDLVRAALDLTDYGLRTGGVQVTTDLAAGLPPVAGDIDQLHQVLVNLLVNAQHALQECPAPRQLTVSTSARDDGWIEIKVADNGPGIPVDLRRRVFEPFFTTKVQGAGTGIGLSFSLGIVEAHGGTLKLADAGGGATFLVSLPADAELSEKCDRQGGIAGGGRVATALVVDDEPDIAEALAGLLALEGYAVDHAVGGQEAQVRLAERDYDIILSDLRMPDLDGPALFDWIERERPELTRRIAFVTGDTLGAPAVRFLTRTRRPFMEKPFTPASLRQLLEEMAKEPRP